ncbi:MAG: hypothetical protein ACLP7Q_20290 [Isosphaeraceae bacterium]
MSKPTVWTGPVSRASESSVAIWRRAAGDESIMPVIGCDLLSTIWVSRMEARQHAQHTITVSRTALPLCNPRINSLSEATPAPGKVQRNG